MIWLSTFIANKAIIQLDPKPQFCQINVKVVHSRHTNKHISVWSLRVLQLKPLSGFITSQQTFSLQICSTFHPKKESHTSSYKYQKQVSLTQWHAKHSMDACMPIPPQCMGLTVCKVSWSQLMLHWDTWAWRMAVAHKPALLHGSPGLWNAREERGRKKKSSFPTSSQ